MKRSLFKCAVSGDAIKGGGAMQVPSKVLTPRKTERVGCRGNEPFRRGTPHVDVKCRLSASWAHRAGVTVPLLCFAVTDIYIVPSTNYVGG